MSATTRIAATALTAGPLLFVAAELTTAAAWTTPAYSFTDDWISDLGVPACGSFQGRLICSPLHDVMNLAFILQGVAFLIGVLLLARGLQGRTRRFTQGVAALVTVGYLLLGLFHTSNAAAANGTLALHFTGAGLAILGVNVLAVVLGVHWWRRPETRGLGHAGLPLGALGLIAVVVLAFTMGTDAPNGLIERIAVYPVVLWQLRVALQLAVRPHSLTAALPTRA